jgi:hypothetical protein
MQRYVRAGWLLWLSLSLSLSVLAQSPWEISLGGGGRYFGEMPSNSPQPLPVYREALSLGLARRLGSSFSLSWQMSAVPWNLKTPLFPYDITDTELRLRFRADNGWLLPERSFIAPYVQAGAGLNAKVFREKLVMDYTVPVGAGLRIQPSRRWALELDGVYHRNLTEYFPYYALRASLIIRLGKRQTSLQLGLSLPAGSDRDTDGLGDSDDECPDEKGLTSLRGCPDRDMDEVPDKLDACPDQAGLMSLRGCPDPDADHDGIENAADRCPEQPGLASLHGCPDRDFDNSPDHEDACPDLAGSRSAQGCPDQDGDGLRDELDRCPTLAGIAALSGCPFIPDAERFQVQRILDQVSFSPSSARLTPEDEAALEMLLAAWRHYPWHKLRLWIYREEARDDISSERVAALRADICQAYLLNRGIPRDKLEIVLAPIPEKDASAPAQPQLLEANWLLP